MKKVFLIHGFQGSPNGGWRPWLMSELEKQEIYACALAMPDPYQPNCEDWVAEISRHVVNPEDEILLVGHSLGVPAILRFLESTDVNISGAVLVSGLVKPIGVVEVDTVGFVSRGFDFDSIKSKCRKFSIIHGEDDESVPLEHAKILAEKLSADLIVVPNGGHLNGSAGFTELPPCLEALKGIFGR